MGTSDPHGGARARVSAGDAGQRLRRGDMGARGAGGHSRAVAPLGNLRRRPAGGNVDAPARGHEDAARAVRRDPVPTLPRGEIEADERGNRARTRGGIPEHGRGRRVPVQLFRHGETGRRGGESSASEGKLPAASEYAGRGGNRAAHRAPPYAHLPGRGADMATEIRGAAIEAAGKRRGAVPAPAHRQNSGGYARGNQYGRARRGPRSADRLCQQSPDDVRARRTRCACLY